MKKLLISIILIIQCFYANADYSVKVFLDNSLKFKNNQTPPPSNINCIFDTNVSTYGILNISRAPEDAEGLNIGESLIVYNGTLIGIDNAALNYPSGLSLGTKMMDVNGLEVYEVCAIDFSIYPPI